MTAATGGALSNILVGGVPVIEGTCVAPFDDGAPPNEFVDAPIVV